MSANYITDTMEFAEGLLGISGDEFLAWIYDPIDPRTLPVAPVLLCAEALGTNAEYLTGLSDDPRLTTALTYDESVLLQAFRDATDEGRTAALISVLEIAGTNAATPNAASPYPNVPLRQPPPANETNS